MTTIPRKAGTHKKARAISSGSLKFVNNYVPSTRQALAGERISFRTMVIHHGNDNTISSGGMAANRVYKAEPLWFGRVKNLQIARCDRPKVYASLMNWRAEQ